MSWLIGWGVLSVGVVVGFLLAALLRANGRDEQHAVAIHAEDNAIRQAAPGEDLSACTLYVSPLFPCAICADRIVRAGIRRVVAYCGHISPDWRASADEAERIFNQAGVECLFTMD